MRLIKTVCIAALLLAGTAIGSAQTRDGRVCSDATLKGDYSFQIAGQILSPAIAAGLVSGVAMTTFDGHGNLTQVDHVLHNGIAPKEEWRPAMGSYEVNLDCTGTMTIEPKPTNSADSATPLFLRIVIGDGGNTILTVVTDTPFTSPFAPVITSTGMKTFPGWSHQ